MELEGDVIQAEAPQIEDAEVVEEPQVQEPQPEPLPRMFGLLGQFSDGSQPFLIGELTDKDSVSFTLKANLGAGIDNSTMNFIGPDGQGFKLMMTSFTPQLVEEEGIETEQEEK